MSPRVGPVREPDIQKVPRIARKCLTAFTLGRVHCRKFFEIFVEKRNDLLADERFEPGPGDRGWRCVCARREHATAPKTCVLERSFLEEALVMFDGSMQVETGAESVGGGPGAWRELHWQLRSVAKRRGALDHEELVLLREAIAVQLWRELGMVSMREYLETVMGYSPGVASERLRVAEALDAMPALEQALETGELSFSAVKAITRIATRKTERAWLAACRGKNVQQVMELLAEREPGDRPESPRKPDLRLRDVHRKLPPQVIALEREARAKLEAELGERVDDAQLYETVLRGFLRGNGDSKKAAAQIAIALCPSCKVARQSGAGVAIAIAPAAFERCACDAQWLGNIDNGRSRAVQLVTPALRDFVFARDGHRCRVPGCRSARNLEVHHILHQVNGGSHDPSNLITLCSGHHAAHHDGKLIIRGTADALEVIRIDDELLAAGAPATRERSLLAGAPEPVDHETAVEIAAGAPVTGERSLLAGAPEPVDLETAEPVERFHVKFVAPNANEIAAMQSDATSALKHLGYRKEIAARAVHRATLEGAATDLETLIRAALQRCG
jgi:hypothetical protein